MSVIKIKFLVFVFCFLVFPATASKKLFLDLENSNSSGEAADIPFAAELTENKTFNSEINNSTTNGTNDSLFYQATTALYVYGGCTVIFSVWSFTEMKRDKIAAINEEWRKPERYLHTLELLGGWIGSLLAQQIYRHKTKKPEYQKVFWFIVVIHIGVIILLYSLVNQAPDNDNSP